MKATSSRSGDATRVVLLVLFILLAVPFALLSLAFIGWRATTLRANDELQQARAAEAVARTAYENQFLEASDMSSVPPPPIPSSALSSAPRRVLEPVIETEYRTETFEVEQPVFNPTTGQMEMQATTGTRVVPTMSTRYDQRFVYVGQDPAVSRLVDELLKMDEEDENRDRKLNELRQRLELEFSGMHDRQEKEIEQTESRLDALKKLHQQRGENRDKIVQRRIDELLGRTDALEWEIRPDRDQSPIGVAGPLDLPAPDTQRLAQPDNYTPRFGSTVPVPLAPQTRPLPPLPPAPNSPVGPAAPTRGLYLPSPSSGLPTVPSPNAWVRPGMQPVQPTQAMPMEDPPSAAQPYQVKPQLVEEREDRVIVNGATESRFEASAPTISRIFELARKSSAAATALRSAELEFETVNKLRENNAITNTEVQRAKANVDQLRREVELSRLEFEALRESMRRSLDFGEEQLNNAQKARDLAETRVNQGLAPTSEQIRVEREVSSARERLEDARANLEQLERALELIRGDEKQEAELPDESPEASSQDTDAEVLPNEP